MNISCVSYDIQVSDLQAGHTYRLRVLAVNEAGVGCPSLPTEPVTAQTPPGQPSWLHTPFIFFMFSTKNNFSGIFNK